jgi:preprotein translocase SecE subunit
METNPAQWYRDTRQYLTEVEAEARKITWPPQKEATAGTIGVVIIVAIVASVLGVVDFGLSQLHAQIIHWVVQG